MEELTLEKFEEASDLVREVTTETKLVYSEYFSSQTGNKVYFKPENMQYTGAYKVRGAYYKISTLSGDEKAGLLAAVTSVLGEMETAGGRDTEKDIYGQPGGYRTIMSKNGMKSGCPACGGPIVKAAYLGGSVYYCPVCQPEKPEA